MLMFNYIIIPLFLIIPIGLIYLNKSHLLMSLLLFEAVLLILIMNMFLLLIINMNYYMFSTLIMLTLGACEASLGLSCLVNMTRSYGSDEISNLSLVKC